MRKFQLQFWFIASNTNWHTFVFRLTADCSSRLVWTLIMGTIYSANEKQQNSRLHRRRRKKSWLPRQMLSKLIFNLNKVVSLNIIALRSQNLMNIAEFSNFIKWRASIESGESQSRATQRRDTKHNWMIHSKTIVSLFFCFHWINFYCFPKVFLSASPIRYSDPPPPPSPPLLVVLSSAGAKLFCAPHGKTRWEIFHAYVEKFCWILNRL